MQVDPATALQYASRLAGGHVDQDALRWLRQGLAAFIAADGTAPLERCLHLVNTPCRRRRMQRDVWLAEAARHIEHENPWHGAVTLANELRVFLTRGRWVSWRDLATPPEGSSSLRSALFHVAKTNNAKPLSAKQVYRIVGHVFK